MNRCVKLISGGLMAAVLSTAAPAVAAEPSARAAVNAQVSMAASGMEQLSGGGYTVERTTQRCTAIRRGLSCNFALFLRGTRPELKGTLCVGNTQVVRRDGQLMLRNSGTFCQ
jgi:hypothetical protein